MSAFRAPAKAPPTPVTYDTLMTSGASLLHEAKFADAVRAFDHAVVLAPASKPKQWQRGLALYYLAKYDAGAQQFEANMAINGSDVEEVVWRAMCDTRSRGLDAARHRLLKCGEDPRVPMHEILGLFSGTATVDDVLKAAAAAPEDTRVGALAYGNFYCGLFHECQGLLWPAHPFLAKAAAAPSSDYMGKLMQMHFKRFLPHGKVIVGGWQLSAGHHDGFDPEKALETIGDYRKEGMHTVDMGDIYTGVEELVGQSVARRIAVAGDESIGRDVRIHTKLVPDLDLLAGGISAEYCDAVVRRSRNRTGMPTLALVQFHWWDWSIEGHVQAYKHLCKTKDSKLAASFGVTNYDAAHVNELVAAECTVSCNQVQYSVVDRRAAADLTGACLQHDVKLICYGVVMGGFLTDRWIGCPEPDLETLENRSLTKYKLVIDEFGGWTLFQDLLNVLHDIAHAHTPAGPADSGSSAVPATSATTATTAAPSVAAVAIAWVLRQPMVGAVILGARHARHIGTTKQACSLVLTEDDMAKIAAVQARAKGPTGAFYAMERVRDSKHGTIMRYNLNRLHTAFHLEELQRRIEGLKTRRRDALVPHWLVMSTKEEVETFNKVAPDIMGDSYGALLQTLSWL